MTQIIFNRNSLHWMIFSISLEATKLMECEEYISRIIRAHYVWFCEREIRHKLDTDFSMDNKKGYKAVKYGYSGL